ncbi:MAG: DUF1858 domain-containing protein [Anaerotruncus sp.]|nr:MAG: DUF1858 domain-containing protein [Anaerotruncus sp.]
MAKVTKDTIIAEALQICPDSAELFLWKSACIAFIAPSASGESIEQACMVHGCDPDKLVNDINKLIGE